MTVLALFRTRLRLFVIPLLAAGGLMLSAQQVWACDVIGKDGKPRPCTFMEELGQCLTIAEESNEACLDGGNGRVLCGVAHFADRAACVAGSFGSVLVAILR